MNTLKKVSENTLWQIATKATNAITGLIIIGIIQRKLGEENTGIYTIIISYISFFFMLVDGGLNAITVKHLLDKKNEEKKIFNNVLTIRIIIASILIIIAITIAQLLPYDPITNTGFSPKTNTGIIVASVTILAHALITTTNGYFQAKQRYRDSFTANTASAITNILLFILLMHLNIPIEIAVITIGISGLIGGTTAIIIAKKTIKTINLTINTQYVKEIIKESAPLSISLILNLIYFRIDSLMLPFFRAVQEVGQYNIAYKIFDTILVIPSYLANALYPNMLEKYSQDVNKFTALVKKSAGTLAITAILTTVITYITAPQIIEMITGEKSPETIRYLRILSTGLLFFFLSSITTWSLIVLKKQKYLAYIYGTTMVCNITLNYIYIPKFGATAAASITILTELLVLITSATLVQKEIKKQQA